MNGGNKFLMLLCAIFFLAFAAVSCWSTTESLFLTLEYAQIPKWIFWIAVIGLFVLTSICTNLVVGSLDNNAYIEHRKLKFVIGLLGFLVLWLLFSMPTNTHTFFYKQMAKEVAGKELEYVDSKLEQLTDTTTYIREYDTQWADFEKKVSMALDQLKQEIANPQRLGFGPEAEAQLSAIENLFELKTGTITRRGTRNTSKKEINEVCKYYDNVVKEQLSVELAHHTNMVRSFLVNFQTKRDKVNPIRQQIKKVQRELNDPQYEREEVLKQARQVIDKSYDVLETSFGHLYQPNEKIYRSDRLTKVTKVWGDYLTGKFKDTNYTLWYWILLSVIVDIAAFAFFDIAAKEHRNNSLFNF